MKIFLTTLLTLFLSLSTFASDKKSNDDVDYVALATILVKDAYYSRANDALKNVDLQDKNLDKAQYFTLQGLVKSKLLQYGESNVNFYKAIENGQTQKSIYVYVAQNSFKLQEYKNVINALDNAPELLKKTPKLLALKAEAYHRLKDDDNALGMLALLIKLHPQHYEAYRQRFTYLVTLGLYQSAVEDADVYMANAKANEQINVSFINALRKSKQTTKAIQLAQNAHLLYPKNATITVLLANLYMDKDMIQSAADLFDKASLQDSKYTKDSTEMFRRAKKYVQALYKSTQILNAKDKYKQKVAIYLEFGNYEKVASSQSALQRNGLLEDQNIVYALAYSYYALGEFDDCETHLKKITDAKLFEKAIELRKNMSKCKNNHWECAL